MSRSSLIIFVRNPELGKVKTRLAKTVGDDKALEIYRLLLQHTQNITVELPVSKYIYYTPNICQNDLWNGPYQKLLQVNGDLGYKIKSALTQQFHNFDKVCIIGSDCIELSQEIIEDAYKKLDENDVVIGPANDGGYYLIGMNKIHESLFDDMKWSTDQVLSDTVVRIKEQGLSYSLLPTLTDIDTEEDWINCNK